MIQTTKGQIERALKTLSFESNIAYVDFESGYYSKSRSGFADLDRFTISNNIAESTELQKTIAKLVLTEGKLLIL
jgi:hypothetical protein